MKKIIFFAIIIALGLFLARSKIFHSKELQYTDIPCDSNNLPENCDPDWYNNHNI